MYVIRRDAEVLIMIRTYWRSERFQTCNLAVYPKLLDHLEAIARDQVHLDPRSFAMGLTSDLGTRNVGTVRVLLPVTRHNALFDIARDNCYPRMRLRSSGPVKFPLIAWKTALDLRAVKTMFMRGCEGWFYLCLLFVVVVANGSVNNEVTAEFVVEEENR